MAPSGSWQSFSLLEKAQGKTALQIILNLQAGTHGGTDSGKHSHFKASAASHVIKAASPGVILKGAGAPVEVTHEAWDSWFAKEAGVWWELEVFFLIEASLSHAKFPEGLKKSGSKHAFGLQKTVIIRADKGDLF